MMNLKNSKRKRIFAAVLAGVILAMVIPMAMYAFG